MSFLFIKDLGICHEEPLSIIPFCFPYRILRPSISIISHSILTLHHSCTSTSKSYPTSHQPNWPSIKKGYLIVVTREPTIGSFVAATQEPTVRKESLLLPHKNHQWEEINQLLEGCSFQLWHFFLCMWELQILYGCKLRKWCMRACFAFSLKGSPLIICGKFMTKFKVCRLFSH